MTQSVIQRSFAGGELAPALAVRADTAKYQTGLRRCRNFLVQRHGGVTNRAGTRFTSACKTDDPSVMLLRYVSENEGESLLLELGDGYIRFFQNGSALEVDPGDIDPWDILTNYVVGDLVTDTGVTYYALVDNVGIAPPDAPTWFAFTGDRYELPSPFGTDLPAWVQSGRIITLTHKLHPPYELEQLALTNWVLRVVDTSALPPAPTGLGVTPGGIAGLRTFGYVVTAALADTYEESPASAQVVTGGIVEPTPDAPHVLAWSAVTGAVEYYVYCDPFGNGTYGFIGTATGAVTFNDTGIDPDFAITPPVPRILFATTDDYPHRAAYFQQRRFFANTVHNPDSVWGSRTGFTRNFAISSPLQDDDSILFRIAGNNHHAVRHLVALKKLIVLTGAGEWTVTNPAGGSLTPSGIDADQEVYVGASDVTPVVVGNSILYVQARGRILRDLQFDQQVEGFGGRDLTLFAAHLVDGYSLTRIDYAQTPHSIVWAVRNDGTLLGLTYIREQDVWGWHRHDTVNGTFEDVCVVPELGEDAVYVIVKRTIDGDVKRYIERLEERLITDFGRDAFFVDSGLTYDGVPVDDVAGLEHLEGETVKVVADGAVLPGPFVVTAGALALPDLFSVIHVGLPIEAEVELLDLDVQGAAVRDKKKRVGSVTLLLEASARTFQAGPDAAHLKRYQLKPSESATDAYTGTAELNLTSSFNDYGRVLIRHSDPLPITILGVVPNLELGG